MIIILFSIIEMGKLMWLSTSALCQSSCSPSSSITTPLCLAHQPSTQHKAHFLFASLSLPAPSKPLGWTFPGCSYGSFHPEIIFMPPPPKVYSPGCRKSRERQSFTVFFRIFSMGVCVEAPKDHSCSTRDAAGGNWRLVNSSWPRLSNSD